MFPRADDVGEIEDGRERLIAAAARRLIDADGTVVRKGLTKKSLAELTGRHPSNLEAHFNDKNEVITALLERLARVPQPDMGRAVDELIDAAGDPADAVAILDLLFAPLEAGGPDSERLLALVAGWATLRHDPEVEQLVRDGFSNVNAHGVDAIARLMDLWGLQLRSPWDLDRLARLMLAIRLGLEILEELDEGSTDGDLAAIGKTLLTTATRYEGDDLRSVDGVLAETGRRFGQVIDARTDVSDTGAERLFAELNRELEAKGYNGTTLADVAEAAGLPESAIASTFGNLDQLICRRLGSLFGPLAEEVPFDQATGLFGTRDLARRHLNRLEATGRESPDLCRAVLAMMTGGGEASAPASEFFAELAQPMIDILRDAKDNDELLIAEIETAALSMLTAAMFRVSLGAPFVERPLDLSAAFWR